MSLLRPLDLLACLELTEPSCVLIRDINASAPIHQTTRSEIDLSLVLDIKAYSPNPQETPLVPQIRSHAPSAGDKGAPPSERDSAPSHAHAHGSSSSIKSLVLPILAANSDQHKRLIRWIQTLLWDPAAFAASASEEPEVLRLKGIIWSADEPGQGWVLQGVRGVYELEDVSRDSAEEGEGKIVIIGRFVQGLETSLRDALAALTPI